MLYNRIVKMALSVLAATLVFSGVAYSQSAPPSDLEASAKGNVIHLMWKAPESESEVTYNIYRAMAPSVDPGSSENPTIDPTKLEFTKLGTVIETTYQDKIEDVAEGGQLYVYYVVAVDNEGTESAGTNYVNVNVGVSKTQSMNQY